ncbi:MAG: ISAzo13 family transposase [Bifidobacteriaceae bacterium]|jgi:hypothetical protein|nr:ISAzo13 family transposase [Bifidobacteriaceae bacterium]
MAEALDTLGARFSLVGPHLNEFQRRLWLGAEACEAGSGGVALVADAAGVARDTVRRGRAEALAGAPGAGGPARARRPGGGRKRAEAHDSGLVAALEALVDGASRGDPESPLRWTCKSTRDLAAALRAGGHDVSDFVVRRVLHQLGYSLQSNRKTAEGSGHPDRDDQFEHINTQVKQRLAAGLPVISVDAKKKELVGEFKNPGREWAPKGAAPRVNVHDFPDPELGRANPYGVYDIAADQGWVSVGTDHDTAAFAVHTIGRWWQEVGRPRYPQATSLLVTADGGGSNSHRTGAWKAELAQLAAHTGLEITVCHFPPGTSKWNKIEHRLFSFITMNWRGRPLISHEVIVQTIAATTTRTGLTVQAELDTAPYPLGRQFTAKQVKQLEADGILVRCDFHGDWNYTIKPPTHPAAGDNT